MDIIKSISKLKNLFYYIRICLFVIILTSLFGCKHKRTYFPQLEPVDVRLIRFDSALLHISIVPTDTLKDSLIAHQDFINQDIRRLYNEYPTFMPTFVEDILGFSSADTSMLQTALISYLTDTVYGFEHTNKYEQEVFADVSDIEKPLSEAFARIHWLYPEWDTPTLYLFVSGFQSAIYFTEDGLAVGADMYLGSDYPYYRQVVYQYQLQTMRKECIPVDVTSAWLFSHIPYTSSKNRLLEQMIYRGKVMYLLACLFDELPGYEIMGYTKEQWDWCEYHERAIWHRMMDKRDLFKTEQRILSSYLNDGPFTSEISQESPGRVGTWMGWRIVESYMEHNDTISLQSLMEQSDAQLILEKSFYKP